MNRKERYDIAMLRTAHLDIVLGEGQFFCETPKSYEIWDSKPLRRVKRINRTSVLVVVLK